MPELPINIQEKDLYIEDNLVCLTYDNNKYAVKAPVIDEIFYEDDRLKILHYLLTAPKSGATHLSLKLEYCETQLSSALRPVRVDHDPFPGNSIFMHPFSSLQSIQWHLLCHGIADYWLNSEQPIILPNKIDEDMVSMWQSFQKTVNCKRWGSIDFSDRQNFQANKKQWFKTRKKVKRKQRKKNQPTHGCAGCIDEHGVDDFLKCCRFFEDYRITYLNRINMWVKKTIQDKDMLGYYKNPEQAKSFHPARRHIHMRNRRTNDIYAYVIDSSYNNIHDVYLMVFEQKSRHKDRYTIRTVYGIASHDTEKEALQSINNHAMEQKHKEKVEFNHYCHKINWEEI